MLQQGDNRYGERTCHEWKLGPTGGGTEENRQGEGACVGRGEVGRVEGRGERERRRAGSCDKV